MYKYFILEYFYLFYGGFDWFVVIIFLMFGGNLEKFWNFFYKFFILGCFGYFWILRFYCFVSL